MALRRTCWRGGGTRSRRTTRRAWRAAPPAPRWPSPAASARPSSTYSSCSPSRCSRRRCTCPTPVRRCHLSAADVFCPSDRVYKTNLCCAFAATFWRLVLSRSSVCFRQTCAVCFRRPGDRGRWALGAALYRLRLAVVGAPHPRCAPPPPPPRPLSAPSSLPQPSRIHSTTNATLTVQMQCMSSRTSRTS